MKAKKQYLVFLDAKDIEFLTRQIGNGVLATIEGIDIWIYNLKAKQ